MMPLRMQETVVLAEKLVARPEWALPEAPLAMPLQVLEAELGLFKRWLAGEGESLPVQGN